MARQDVPIHETALYAHLRKSFQGMNDTVYCNLVEELQRILAGRRDINARNGYGESPLMSACLRPGSSSDAAMVVHALILLGADVNSVDNFGNSCVHAAVKRGSVTLTRILIEHGAVSDCQNDYGSTPLHYAAANYKSNGKVLTWLLKQGNIHVDVPDNSQTTSLHLATELGHTNAAKALLEHGADPNIRNEAGKTPRQLAWGTSIAIFE